mgnify:CR=1 FL=1
MRSLRRRLCQLGVAGLCVLMTVAPARAQIADALSTYDARNGLGYTSSVREALGAGLVTGFFSGGPFHEGEEFRARVSVHQFRVFLRDQDKTFEAGSPQSLPYKKPPSLAANLTIDYWTETTVEAPSLLGSPEAVLFENKTSTGTNPPSFGTVLLPGGLDLDQLSANIPQLELGWKGYEATVRYASISSGSSEIGELDVWGLGLRADVTDFIDPRLPIHADVLLTYQSFEYGGGVINGQILTIGAQVGLRLGWSHVYTGVSYDTVESGLDYVRSDGIAVDVQETKEYPRAHLGIGMDIPYAQFVGEISYNSLVSVSFGLSLGL